MIKKKGRQYKRAQDEYWRDLLEKSRMLKYKEDEIMMLFENASIDIANDLMALLNQGFFPKSLLILFAKSSRVIIVIGTHTSLQVYKSAYISFL